MYKAQSTVSTPKAARYLKALCNHFNRKVEANYTDEHGTVNFGFATCEMKAQQDTLWISVQATDDENFVRVKFVLSDHLERFSADEALTVHWDDLS